MWLFATYLPLFVGDKIPIDDPHWQCYFVLLEITKYSTARVVSLTSAEYLETLIEQHHHMLKTIYPHQSIIPKMHYLVHFSSLLIK